MSRQVAGSRVSFASIGAVRRGMIAGGLAAVLVGTTAEVAAAGATLQTTGAKLVITNDSWSDKGFTGNFRLYDTKCDGRTIYYRVTLQSYPAFVGYAQWSSGNAKVGCHHSKDYGKKTYDVPHGRIRNMTVEVCRHSWWRKINCDMETYRP